MWVSKRALSAKEKGRKGGTTTARTHDSDFLEKRASNAGTKTRDTYGIGYYRYLRTLRTKVKTPKEKIIEKILPNTSVPESSTDLMVLAAKTIL